MNQYNNVVHSESFHQFLSLIVGTDMKLKKIEWLSFGKGDYTLLYDNLKQKQGAYVVLDFHNFSEEFGGFTSVIKNDEELARIVGQENTCTIFSLQKKATYFTKYINHKAGKEKRLCMVAQFSK